MKAKGQLLFLSVVLILIINNANAVDVSTGWINPDSLAAPITGDYTEGVLAALGPEAAFDNVRLHAQCVYDYYSNTTFGAYLGGTSDDDAGIYVISFNHSTQKQTQPRCIYMFSEIEGSGYDGHSYPTIVKSLDGHIQVFFCDQSGSHNNIQIRFAERGTVESGYTTTVLNNGGESMMGRPADASIRGEYPKPFVSRNGTMYFFTRYIPYSNNELWVDYNGESYRAALRPQVYVKSEDNGLTWDTVRMAMMSLDTTYYLTEPYLTQTIAEPKRDGVEERVHFAWTLAAGIGLCYDEDGTVHHNYHNAHAKNIYHAYFVPGEDNYYSVDGTNLGKEIRDEEMDSHCLVERTPVGVYPVPMTCAQNEETRSDNESIMGHHTMVDGEGNVIVNKRLFWNGTQWDDTTINVTADVRVMDWRNGSYYAYNGMGNYFADNLDDTWNNFGAIDLSGTEVADRLDNIGMNKSCPATGASHPEAHVWVKLYPGSSERYGGFVILGGHRTSYVPAKVIIEVEQGTANPGDEVNINAYIADENGARIMTADNEITFTSSIGSITNTTTTADQGLGKTALTINGGVTPGEYKVNASVSGLESGFAYITIRVNDDIAPSTPQGLTGNAVSSSQIDLQWNSSTDNIGVAGYRVYRNGTDLAATADTTYSSINLLDTTSYTYTVTAYDANGNESNHSDPFTATTYQQVSASVATSLIDVAIFPNPFSSTLNITYNLTTSNTITIYMYSIQGSKVGTVEKQFKNSGTYTIQYNPGSLSKGLYYLVLQSGNYRRISKVIHY